MLLPQLKKRLTLANLFGFLCFLGNLQRFRDEEFGQRLRTELCDMLGVGIDLARGYGGRQAVGRSHGAELFDYFLLWHRGLSLRCANGVLGGQLSQSTVLLLKNINARKAIRNFYIFNYIATYRILLEDHLLVLVIAHCLLVQLVDALDQATHLVLQYGGGAQVQEVVPLVLGQQLVQLAHHNVGQRRVLDHNGNLGEEVLVADLQGAECLWSEVAILVHLNGLRSKAVGLQAQESAG